MGVDAAKGDEEGFDIGLVEGPVKYALPPACEEALNLVLDQKHLSSFCCLFGVCSCALLSYEAGSCVEIRTHVRTHA
jgi:hypothetical protein